jgi:apolipoprotein N-acyltransferase
MKIKLDHNYKKIIFSVITGLLAVFAFPKFNLSFLIWASLIPLVFVIMQTGLGQSFLYGFVSGFIFNAVGLYWLVPMLQSNTGSYPQAIFAACVLWTYLALYWGIWGLCLVLSKNITQKVVKNELNANILIIIFGSCIWVLLEYTRTYLLTGFPWMLIGYSQFECSKIIQIAEFTSVYGVSFLVMFCNLCFYFWALKPKSNSKYLYIALTLIVAVVLFGIVRTHKFKFFGDKKYSVAIVQPNIAQDKKWDAAYKDEIISKLKKYACEIAENKTDLVLWPEAVMPEYIPYDKEIYNYAKNIAGITGGLSIMGSLHNEGKCCYNSALAFENSGGYKVAHNKNHLVPFGEFIPFRKFFGKFFGVLNQMGDSLKGTDANVFDNGRVRAGSIICSENWFPDISRRFALSGARVLTNHTNDAWFFDTAALPQHFAMNVFRAVETRKDVIVSANSGISGIIKASGAIVDRTPSSKSALLRGIFCQNDFKTFYVKYGDVFIYLCMGLVFFVLIPMGFAKSFCKNRSSKIK